MIKKYFALATLVTLFGSGCSSSPATPSVSVPTSPSVTLNAESSCDAVLTVEEAKTITGITYTRRDAKINTLGKIVVTNCTYDDDTPKSAVKPFSILTRFASNQEEAKTIFEQSKTASYKDGEALTDIGEQALWSPMFSQVSTIKGQTWLIVSANKNKEMAIKIAKAVVEKLK